MRNGEAFNTPSYSLDCGPTLGSALALLLFIRHHQGFGGVPHHMGERDM